MTAQGGHIHLIIGAGITAAAFLDRLHLTAGDTLIVLAPDPLSLGRGAAYAAGQPGTPWRYSYLLNSPADDIDPAFAEWLVQNWDYVTERMADRTPNWLAAAQSLVEAGDVYGVNAPREFYGDFMVEQTQERIAGLRAQGVSVLPKVGIATTIASDGDDLVVTLQSGETLDVHSVDVAPGGPSNLRIHGDDGPYSAPALFGYEERIAEHIQNGAEIFCIGGNAAMLDTLRLCQSYLPNDALRFVACAPDGEVPPPLIPRLPRKLTRPTFSTGHETAESFLTEAAAAIAKAKSEGDEMREIRAGFRAFFLEHPLSEFVTNPEEAKRIPATFRFWLRGGTRDTILDMRTLVAKGQVQMMTGSVTNIRHSATSALVEIQDSTGGKTEHSTGFVVNCAGAGPGSEFDPLTTNMLANGHLHRCPISKGLKVGTALKTALPNVRFLSPAVTVIGDEVMAMPLYDAHMLRTYVERSSCVSL